MLRRLGLGLVLGFVSASSAGCSIDTEGIAPDFNPLDDVLDTSATSETSLIEDSTVEDSTVEDTGSMPDTTTAGDTMLGDTTGDTTVVTDSGTSETVVDTGTPDTGTPDTGTPDTGTPDTGTPDTGTPDTSTPDTGTPDTGTPDTGSDDTGSDTGVSDTAPETPITGTLIVTNGSVASGTTTNLATEGTLDWAHWGDGDVSAWNHKLGGLVLPARGTMSGAARYWMYPVSFSWTGGTPTTSATTNDGLYLDTSGESMTFDAIGSVAVERVLRVYTTYDNGFGAGTVSGTIQVTLSDSSAPAYTHSIIHDGGSTGGGTHVSYWNIRYRVVSATGKATVKITQTSAAGFVSLLAATVK